MLWSLESLLIDGAFLVLRWGAARPFRNGLEQVGRPGSKNMCRRKLGFPRNLGDPDISTEKTPEGDTGLPTPGPPLTLGDGGRDETSRVLWWYRQTKATKCGGMDVRKSECLDSTVEAGERVPVRTPSREARHRERGTVVGRYDECLEIREAYTRNNNG
jgi:hypothetical protein